MNFQKTHRIHPHTLPYSINRNFGKDNVLFSLKIIKEKVKENGIEKIGPKFFSAPTKKSRKLHRKSKIRAHLDFGMTLISKFRGSDFESKLEKNSKKPVF